MKEDPEEWIKRTHAHKLELYKADDARKAQETAAALAAGLPDPHLKRKNPVCPFDTYWCDGPKHSHKCAYCAGEMKMDPSDPLYPGDQVIASLKACADPRTQRKPTKSCARAGRSNEPGGDIKLDNTANSRRTSVLRRHTYPGGRSHTAPAPHAPSPSKRLNRTYFPL
jgi:hypothetical protein